MIHSVSANQESFHNVEFEPGFNIIVADTVGEPTEHAERTRNAAGKTFLVAIIQFLLGANARDSEVVRDELAAWEFSMDIDVGSSRVVVSRSVERPTVVSIDGTHDGWPVAPQLNDETGRRELRIADWTRVLGAAMFNLEEEVDSEVSHRPTFRGLISYFARYKSGAFQVPFKYFSTQRVVQVQVANTFLLGLNWQDAADWQRIKDRRDGIKKLRKAVEQGALGTALASRGRLEARKVTLDRQIAAGQEQLAVFQVHEQYDDIGAEADRLTSAIHELTNANVIRRRKITLYEQHLADEAEPNMSVVLGLYEEASVSLGDAVVNDFEAVSEFHRRVVANRHDYLSGEVAALAREMAEAAQEAERLSEQRAALMEVLRTHGALEEFVALQNRIAGLQEEAAQATAALEQLQTVEEGEGRVNADEQALRERARLDMEERRPEWEAAIAQFAENTGALYSEPGVLVIDIGNAGFEFDYDIDGKGSRGVTNVMIFSYDLMLSQRWSGLEQSPGFLLHDSEIFDGVDERQIAGALMLAAREAGEHDFQYICSLNSDDLPSPDFLTDLDLGETRRLQLTDETEEGRLLGIAF